MERQLARDVGLLSDLRITVQDVLTWDHTRSATEAGAGAWANGLSGAGVTIDADGGASSGEPFGAGQVEAAGGGSGGISPDVSMSFSPPPSRGGDTEGISPEQRRRPPVAVVETVTVGFAAKSGDGDNEKDAGNAHSIVNHSGAGGILATAISKAITEEVPVDVGEGACDVRSNSTDKIPGKQGGRGGNRSTGVSRHPLKDRASEYDSDGINISSGVSGCLQRSNGNSTGTSPSSSTNGSEFWADVHRRPLVGLTDDERMGMLRHVRPSVFGGPVGLGATNKNPRPRSATAAVTSTRRRCAAVVKARHHQRASKTSGIMPDGCADDGLQHQRYRELRGREEQTWSKASKRRGVLCPDLWVEKIEKSPPLVSSTSAWPSVSTASRHRNGSGDGGGDRAHNFLNSVAFGVNMRMLEALAVTTGITTRGGFTRPAGTATLLPSSRTTSSRGAQSARCRRLESEVDTWIEYEQAPTENIGQERA